MFLLTHSSLFRATCLSEFSPVSINFMQNGFTKEKKGKKRAFRERRGKHKKLFHKAEEGRTLHVNIFLILFFKSHSLLSLNLLLHKSYRFYFLNMLWLVSFPLSTGPCLHLSMGPPFALYLSLIHQDAISCLTDWQRFKLPQYTLLVKLYGGKCHSPVC